MKWLQRLWEIIKLYWAWRKEDRQETQQAQEQVREQIIQIQAANAGQKEKAHDEVKNAADPRAAVLDQLERLRREAD